MLIRIHRNVCRNSVALGPGSQTCDSLKLSDLFNFEKKILAKNYSDTNFNEIP